MVWEKPNKMSQIKKSSTGQKFIKKNLELFNNKNKNHAARYSKNLRIHKNIFFSKKTFFEKVKFQKNDI